MIVPSFVSLVEKNNNGELEEAYVLHIKGSESKFFPLALNLRRPVYFSDILLTISANTSWLYLDRGQNNGPLTENNRG